MNRLQLIRRATNLFDNKTLAIHPASTIYGTFTEEQRQSMDISQKTIRLSVGLENIEDLLADMGRAFTADWCADRYVSFLLDVSTVWNSSFQPYETICSNCMKLSVSSVWNQWFPGVEPIVSRCETEFILPGWLVSYTGTAIRYHDSTTGWSIWKSLLINKIR